jgi:predicted phosphodiesterase
MQIKKYLLEQGVSTIQDAYKYYEYFKSQGYSSNEESYKRYCRMLFKGKIKNVVPDKTIETSRVEDIQKGLIESTINTDKKVKDGPAGLDNAEDMAKYCNIDLDKWEAIKIVSNIWGPQDDPYWQFKVFWALKYKKGEISPKSAAKEFEDLINNISLPKRKYKKINEDGKTVVIGLTDSHIGQLTWGEEIGSPDKGNWDLNIATSELLKVIDFYCSYYQDKKVKKFILPIGSDLFNVNSELGTINNTPQDEDVRKGKTFRTIMETMIIIIEALAEIAPVDAIYIPGNHDKDVAYELTIGLCAAFRKQTDRIKIDAGPQDHKYIKVGNTLIGIAHGKVKGKDLKPSELPQIMARDVGMLWGETLYHEWLIGHYHKLKDLVSDDINGTIIRVMPSITQLSYWTYSSGLKATRQMEAFEYDDISGHIKTVVYRP